MDPLFVFGDVDIGICCNQNHLKGFKRMLKWPFSASSFSRTPGIARENDRSKISISRSQFRQLSKLEIANGIRWFRKIIFNLRVFVFLTWSVFHSSSSPFEGCFLTFCTLRVVSPKKTLNFRKVGNSDSESQFCLNLELFREWLRTDFSRSFEKRV